MHFYLDDLTVISIVKKTKREGMCFMIQLSLQVRTNMTEVNSHTEPQTPNICPSYTKEDKDDEADRLGVTIAHNGGWQWHCGWHKCMPSVKKWACPWCKWQI